MRQRIVLACLLAAFCAACGSGVTAAEPEASGSGTGSGSGNGGAGNASSSSSEGGSGSGGTAGAGGQPSMCEVPPGAAAFEVGTGESCFTRLTTGGDVPLMAGPQGGYHIWMAFGCAGCDSPAHVRWGARDPSTGGDFPDTYPAEAMVELSDSAWRQTAGVFLYMPGLSWDPEYPPPAKGTPITLWAELLEGSTVLHQADVDVKIGETVQWDPCEETPEDPNCQLDGRN